MNAVRDYAWGSTTAIPDLRCLPATDLPQAELWMGAHPSAPSRIVDEHGSRPLDQLIADDPEHHLGPPTVQRFGPQLPFLLKVLAADAPLSLQVHPALAQAQAGFAREEADGVPVAAPHRNYRDANHKPEILCALEEFTGVCGFRQPLASAALLQRLALPGLQPITELLTGPASEAERLRQASTHVLTINAAESAQLLVEVGAALRRLADDARSVDDAKAMRDYAHLADHYPGDPGLLSALLLNHFTLEPGQAVYLAAGVPHAYFRGLGVELMANSDNVLRAGLTTKHIDVPELLRTVRFEPSPPSLVYPTPLSETTDVETYTAPVDDFRLYRHRLGKSLLPTGVPQILLCTEGQARLRTADGEELILTRGDSCYIPAASSPVTATGAPATAYRATLRLSA